MARVTRLAPLVLLGLALSALVPATAEAQRRRRGGDAGARGTLVIQTTHEGAEVLVDEELVGTTPLDPIALSPGSHTLRVRLPGYTEYTDVVQIAAGQTNEVPVDLLALSEVLEVTTTPPGAHVYVDGNFMGESPVELDLIEGTRSLRIVLRGYHEVIREVEARAGSRDELSLELEALPPDALLGGPDTTEWYEEPITWIAIGGGAVALAVIIAVVAVVTTDSSQSQIDAFCASPGGCIRVDAW